MGQTALAATEPAAHALRLAPPVAGLSFRGPQMINRGLSFRLRVLRQVHRELVEQVELLRQKRRRAEEKMAAPFIVRARKHPTSAVVRQTALHQLL